MQILLNKERIHGKNTQLTYDYEFEIILLAPQCLQHKD